MTNGSMPATTEAMKAAVEAVAVAKVEAGTKLGSESVVMGPDVGRPTLKPLTFDWSDADKCTELRNFRLALTTYIKHTIWIMQTEYPLPETG